AAGIETIKEIMERGVIDNAIVTGNYLKEKLISLKAKYPGLIRDVRGRGMMLGIELQTDCEKIVHEMLEHKVLVNCTNTNVIRLLPPLILSFKEVDFVIEQFDTCFKNFSK
ncbi:MAG: aminotransferase class III-fold pyridoxal phosphate-dependent enzyme, partial [Bacteroidetes bacterium]|nr:aminotransferase class III-fold pyridoxal phosphate-dependent enzyme [Bacteroidota bacterium]